jgi:hypothetical protein
MADFMDLQEQLRVLEIEKAQGEQEQMEEDGLED